ncbi:MAG: uracil-DNA glycosylase [Azospirillaceae bacterium]|nr:uracil-DNA glycosylase [Azospirillaceae bacterium]
MANRGQFPDYFNGPVPSFGSEQPSLLIVGLAPGLKGANRTGRPFTGDYAGDLLYPTLQKFGFADGEYRADPGDSLVLRDARLINAVRCVPPQNKPERIEIVTCRAFFEAELATFSRVKVIVALGGIAHGAILAAHGLRPSAQKFSHGGEFALPTGVTLLATYHPSRRNTNSGLLTTTMFHEIFARVRQRVDA